MICFNFRWKLVAKNAVMGAWKQFSFAVKRLCFGGKEFLMMRWKFAYYIPVPQLIDINTLWFWLCLPGAPKKYPV